MPITRPFVRTPVDPENRSAVLTVHNARHFKSGIVVLRPGEGVGAHNTGPREEVLVILSGSASVEANGERLEPAPAGSVVYLPAQTTHNVVNRGAEELRYVYVVSPQ